MKKPKVKNAFTDPDMFKINMSTFRRSGAGMVGGTVRANNVSGGGAPAFNTKNSANYTKVK